MSRLTAFFTELMRRYLPDPFVFAILLTMLTMLLAVVVQGRAPLDTISDWGKGFWSLLAFTTQMAVILAMGYVLATAPLVDRLLDRITASVHTPRGAIIAATLVGGIGCYLNWGFGLVIGGIVAQKLARKIRGVHYPLIVASAFSGFTVWGMGLSATIPVMISTKGHALESRMGVVPLSQTIFSPVILIVTFVILVTLPLLNAALHPKAGEAIIEIAPTPAADGSGPADGAGIDRANDGLLAENTFASRLNNSRAINYLIGLLAAIYVVRYFIRGGALDLNIINYVIVFLGIVLLATPQAYVDKLNEGIRTIGGILLQYPFYAGIMAIMAASGLVDRIAGLFVDISSPTTLPFWGLVSSFLINFFAPSGGGHWVIQGPFMVDAAKAMHASVPQTAMSVMLGSAWNDLVQPFWILPTLALSKLKLKDVMGYNVVMMVWVGIVYTLAVLIWVHI